MTDISISQRARAAKAMALTDALHKAGATAASVAYLDDAGWEWAAKIAGVRPPSAETRRLVAFSLAERERLALPTRSPDSSHRGVGDMTDDIDVTYAALCASPEARAVQAACRHERLESIHVQLRAVAIMLRERAQLRAQAGGR